jgi:hypothetical protein
MGSLFFINISTKQLVKVKKWHSGETMTIRDLVVQYP